MRSNLGRIANVAAAARAVNGPLVSVSSNVPYARSIEEGHRRRVGAALMFARGLAETRPEAKRQIAVAIIQGPVQAGAAKERINQLAVRNVRKYTPVLTGRLRDSVQASGRIQ